MAAYSINGDEGLVMHEKPLKYTKVTDRSAFFKTTGLNSDLFKVDKDSH